MKHEQRKQVHISSGNYGRLNSSFRNLPLSSAVTSFTPAYRPLDTPAFPLKPTIFEEFHQARLSVLDANFPTNATLMADAFGSPNINTIALQFEQIMALQPKFFARVVPSRCHIDYSATEAIPSEAAVSPGFPASGSFGEVVKIKVTWDAKTVYARKRIFQVDETCKL